MLAIPSISAAACVIRRDKFEVNRLIAYAIATDGQAAPSFEKMQEQLERRLPRHMIPSSLVWLAAFPLTPNGKLDRRALPAPVEEAPVHEYVAPQSDIEERLAAIWRKLLKTQR